MKRIIKIGIIFLLGSLIFSSVAHAQDSDSAHEFRNNPDSVRAELDKRPSFTFLKDSYMIIGTSLFEKPDAGNSGVKFQTSFSQRITKSKLPFDSYLFISFSQKVFWEVFRKSVPINDISFNPAIGLSKYIIKDNRYKGKLTLMIEHESNGKDSIDSRSWERLTFAGSVRLHPQIDLEVKTWIPFIDGKYNKDLLKYAGIFQASADYRTASDRFHFSATLTKRADWGLNFNTVLDAGYRISKNENFFLYLQYYNGYYEGIYYYKSFRNMLRFGFLIKPQDFRMH